MENIKLTPSSSVEDTLKASSDNQAIVEEEQERVAKRVVLRKIQNAVSPQWKYALLGIAAEVEMKFWKKINRKSRNVKKHLTFDSSIEEVFAAPLEEQDRWAEDIANRSNAFMAKRLEELRKREENSEKIAIGA